MLGVLGQETCGWFSDPRNDWSSHSLDNLQNKVTPWTKLTKRESKADSITEAPFYCKLPLIVRVTSLMLQSVA